MRESVLHWLKIHEDEIVIFLWAAALLFLLRASGMILNNFAETAFLKRYGIEYLPVVNMINTVATFFITGLMAAFMAKIPGARVLFYLFIFCGASVAAIRLAIPTGAELIYPLLFMLKSQFELLQALLFWNLANDLFNTRQSKRVFPLLTAGGVVGLIIGSFGTPYMAEVFRFDNLLYVYIAVMLAGAVVIRLMGLQFPAIMRRVKAKKSGKQGLSMAAEARRVWPLVKESALFKIVLVLSFAPNVVIPIMNYQFNFTVDQFFPTESGMLSFFSYFRGVLNIVSLFILLFVGRLYGYFGIPLALMLHPANYVVAFLAFFFRFDIFSAIYARMSTNVLRTTVNMPAVSILIGLFPESYRAMVRPFLRGTVVRAGLLLGSGLILVSVNLFHPRWLSLVALPFVIGWVAAPVILRKKYASILKNLISRNLLDVRSLEEEDPGRLFRKDGAGEDLVRTFLAAEGEDAVWYARLLKSLDVADMDRLILEALENQDETTRVKLLEMLSGSPERQIAEGLVRWLDRSRPRQSVAVLKAIRDVGTEESYMVAIRDFINDEHPEVRAYAAACLYPRDPGGIGRIIDEWLSSGDPGMRRSGIIATGETGDKENYAARLENMVQNNGNEAVCPDILHALAALGSEKTGALALELLDHPSSDIRGAALSVMEITGAGSLRRAVDLLGDPDPDIREAAKRKIAASDYIDSQVLIGSLNRPSRVLRENLFDLLETLEIRDVDLYRFATENLQACYEFLAKAAALETVSENRYRKILHDHLAEKKDLVLENILRVIAIHDNDSRMRTVLRGLFSKNARMRGNAIELLGSILDRRLFAMFQPLLEGFSPYRTLQAGGKYFRLPDFTSPETHLFPAFLESTDWVEVVIALALIGAMHDAGKPEAVFRQAEIIEKLCLSPVPEIQQSALGAWARMNRADAKGKIMNNQMPVSEKILLLRNIGIFSGLSVAELGAIATVTEEEDYLANVDIIREGEPGETVFLIIDGEVAVYKRGDGEDEIKLDTMTKGDYFGEMALFEETERSATIRTTAASRFLVLHKQEFKEIVREYPRIALQICTALSHRLRHLQSRLTRVENKPVI